MCHKSPSPPTPLAQRRGTPFGQLRWESGQDPTEQRFDFIPHSGHTLRGTGRPGQRLEGFGLLDYNARYYDASLGRFISPDSVALPVPLRVCPEWGMPDYGNPQDLNRYGYVRGNPLASGDPTGHCPPSVAACRGLDGRPIDDYYRYGDPEVMDSLPLSGLNPWYPVDILHLQRNSFEPKGPMVEALKMVTIALKKPADVDLIGGNVSFLPPSAGPGQTGGIEAVRLRQKGHPFDKYLSSMQDSPANVQADGFRESKWAIYEYDGSAEGKGGGFSANPYYGEGWNVSELSDWSGWFDGYNLTVAAGGDGVSISVFWNPPLDATKPFGYSIGPAAGLETSASHFSVFYSPILPR